MEYYEVRIKIGGKDVDCFKIKAGSKEDAIRICKEKYGPTYYILKPLAR